MKNLLYLSFLFLGLFAFGQPVYKVTEGELQFIHPDFGIVIKKDNAYYICKPKELYTYKGWTYYEEKLDLYVVPPVFLNRINNYKGNIYPEDLKKYNFKKLKNKRFIVIIENEEEDEERDEFHLFQVNNDYFALLNVFEEGFLTRMATSVILDFGRNQKILFIGNSYGSNFKALIIPTKQGLLINHERFDINNNNGKYFSSYPPPPSSYVINEKTHYRAVVTPAHLYPEELETENIFQKYYVVENIISESEKKAIADETVFEYRYFADTLKNNKVILKSFYDQKIIPKSYDSISLIMSGGLIVGYGKSGTDLYDVTLKKINSKELRAVKPVYKMVSIPHISPRPYPEFYNLQILDKNELKLINVIGKEQDHNLINEIKLKEFEPVFAINTEDNWKFLIETVFYNEVMWKDYIDEEIAVKYVFVQQESGKYDCDFYEYYLNKDFNQTQYSHWKELPKNLDSVKRAKHLARIEKDGLVAYFPLSMNVKYKYLEDFNGNFARFTLPNGQKGWLDINGNEYLDD
ncbi:MAG TPA: hypothetical protein VLZ72_06795 [Flavobacterium sp.]|nr:hypothetical protein [Flavobacterium sp.]